MNQAEKDKVRKTVAIAKEDLEARSKIAELIFDKGPNGEPFKMLDLIFHILYHSYYLDKFKDSLPSKNINEAADYYNIEFVNRHLRNILSEYEIITNNLDSIIFNDVDLCN